MIPRENGLGRIARRLWGTVAGRGDAGERELAAVEPLNTRGRDTLPVRDDGSVRVGKVQIAGATDDDIQALLTFQYAMTLSHPGVDRLELARRALAENEPSSAIAAAANAVGVDVAEQNAVIGKAFARLGHLDKAKNFYTQALEHDPAPVSIGEYGTLLVGMGQHDEARRLLEDALERDPNLHRARGALGLVHEAEGRYQDASETLHTALAGEYENSGLLSHYIAVAAATERLHDAEPIVRAFADFYPGSRDIACHHAEVLLALNRAAEARERLELLALAHPDDTRVTDLLTQAEARD